MMSVVASNVTRVSLRFPCFAGNLAYNKTARSSSNDQPEKIPFGVNGDTSTSNCVFAGYDPDIRAWYVVDLGEKAAVFMVTFYMYDSKCTSPTD